MVTQEDTPIDPSATTSQIEPTPEMIELANKLKDEGNEFLKQNKLGDAYNKYTEGIALNVGSKVGAILYSNRAFVDLKLENYGDAITDANKSIENDPDYMKAYYRRASAYLCLFKPKDAIADLQLLQQKYPNDKDLIEKLKKAKTTIKKKMMLSAFEYDDKITVPSSNPTDYYNSIENPEVTKLHLDNTRIEKFISSLTVEDTYKGPKYEGESTITSAWIANEIIAKMKDKVYIHKKYLLQIILSVKKIFDSQPTLIRVTVPNNSHINVVGDIHGQFYDLLNIFKLNGEPSETNPYLFTGDFVDRGSFSVDVVILLLCYKILYPNYFYLTRGNHESRNLNRIYGFEGEVKSKYDPSWFEIFLDLFKSLPLAHVINDKVLTLHGGLFSKDGVKLKHIEDIKRFTEIPESGIMCELLWSDPSELPGRNPSKRGVGVTFGKDIANNFLKDNGLELLIRSHEVKQEGYERIGNVITVFSAPNYCDQMGNKGAIVKLTVSDTGAVTPNFVQFEAVEHPKVPCMAFANTFGFL